jgi:energy-coupling factor transporter transmembrane protein EcfT
VTAVNPAHQKTRRRPPVLPLLREVKGDSAVHRLSAEVKLLALAGMSVTVSYFPSWGSIGIVAGLLLVATLVARIPSGALPRLPAAFWIVLAASGLLASLGGASPYLHIGATRIGLGAVDSFLKFVSIGAVLLFGGLVFGWTTSLGDVAPAVSRLLRPFRRIRLPVDELAVVTALCIRSFPLIISEMRTLFAARRLRPIPSLRDEITVDQFMREIVDMVVAAFAVSVRRAGELADAIVARGGTGAISAGKRKLGMIDVVVAVIVAGGCFAASQIPIA